MQECAEDLHGANEILARGIDDLKQVKTTLVQSKLALADTEAALSAAQQDAHEAHVRVLHDSLTGLPNREMFDDWLTLAISLSDRHDWTRRDVFRLQPI